MKYSLECKATGKVMIKKRIQVKEGIREYILTPDEKGWLSSIKIITEVSDPKKFSSRIEPGNGKVALNIIIDGDRELKEQLIWEFQKLESLLSFNTDGSLKTINWDEPQEDFIPENEEEEKQVSVRNMYFTKEYPEYPSQLREELFAEIVDTKEYFIPLIVPMAFYREGMNEFHSRRYINAFYNFYFVLEDFYAQGKTKNKDIGDAFIESKEVREFMRWMIEDNLVKYDKHRTNIQKFCVEEKVSYGIDGLINLLLKVRGNLHHYSGKSSKHVGTPFLHEDFQSIAFFAMGLTIRAILQRIVEINRARGVKAETRA